MNVLVAGGAGYIGSHTARLLKGLGHGVVIYDNLSRGHLEAATIVGVPVVIDELSNQGRLKACLLEHEIDIVMHFAALALVGESVSQPLLYYSNNVATTLAVLDCMRETGVRRFVLSSTCAVYGNARRMPVDESVPLRPVSPYGRSKMIVEQILADVHQADPEFRYATLRYFNASGCAVDGSLGEDHDPETHLIPSILRAILGRAPKLTVFGTDYPTPDGTCIRDYVHVDDIADAHARAMDALEAHDVLSLNLGSGRGYSVREVIEAVERVTGRKVPVELGPRRPGDAAALFADPSRAQQVLGWEPRLADLDEIVRTAWSWFQARPQGYAPAAGAAEA